jgi:TRAP-type C4-dicarboxylate transport system substrate-binding protein
MKTHNFLTALTLLAAMHCASSAVAGEKWDLPMQWPAGNFYAQSAQKCADKVKEVTKGEVEITIHYNGSLGFKGGEMLRAIRDGLVPIGDVTQRLQVGDEPLMGIEGLPYLAAGIDEMKVLLKHTRPLYDKIAAKNNQKVLYIQPWPGQHVFSAKKIDGLSDLSGLKVRTVDANGTEFFRRLGASPTQLPWGEVVPSLASGAINGVTTSSSSGVDGKFWEFTEHLYLLDWQVPLSSINVNLTAWNKLKPETRAAIESLAKQLEPEFWQVTANEDSVKMKILSDNGIKFTKPDDATKKQVTKIAEVMWADFVKRVPAAGPAIAAYRQEVKK